jgi:hypothetical protein
MLRRLALATAAILLLTAGTTLAAPQDFCTRHPNHQRCQPSVTPTPTPTPSAGLCSTVIHDQYRVAGPDGNLYPTWHPQRDSSGCYFGHDHGSDPSRFVGDYRPAFGYVNAIAGHAEPHNGFKLFLLDDGAGHQWLWTVHMGTSGQNRVCQRFHSVELAIARSGELLAEIRFIADFGRSEHHDYPFRALTPDQCPTQHADALNDGSNGLRQFSVNAIGPDSRQYEPWTLDYRRTVFGFSNATIAFINLSSMTTCADLDCSSMLASNHRGGGAFSVVSVGALRLSSTRGHFTTDVHGRTLGGPVPQFIAGTVTMQTPPNENTNYWPGTDPNVVDYRLRSNDPAVPDGKGDMGAYSIDGQLRLGN